MLCLHELAERIDGPIGAIHVSVCPYLFHAVYGSLVVRAYVAQRHALEELCLGKKPYAPRLERAAGLRAKVLEPYARMEPTLEGIGIVVQHVIGRVALYVP